jgi:hypothetical protein
MFGPALTPIRQKAPRTRIPPLKGSEEDADAELLDTGVGSVSAGPTHIVILFDQRRLERATAAGETGLSENLRQPASVHVD